MMHDAKVLIAQHQKLTVVRRFLRRFSAKQQLFHVFSMMVWVPLRLLEVQLTRAHPGSPGAKHVSPRCSWTTGLDETSAVPR